MNGGEGGNENRQDRSRTCFPPATSMILLTLFNVSLLGPAVTVVLRDLLTEDLPPTSTYASEHCQLDPGALSGSLTGKETH